MRAIEATLVLALLAACQGAPATSGTASGMTYTGSFATGTGTKQASLVVNGVTRSMYTYVPSNLGSNRALLIIFDGTDNDAYSALGSSGAKTLANNQKLVVVAPEQRALPGGDWDMHSNGQRYWETYPNTSRETNNDLALVQAIIAEAKRVHGVNTDRVYTLGFSNGAFFAEFAAFAMPDTIAAFAETSGGLVKCDKVRGPTGCEFFTTTGKTCSAFAAQPGWCSCSGVEKPAAVPTSGRIPPGYLSHPRDDTTISVYYTCALKARLDALGATSSLTVRTGGGHVWPSNFASTAWPFLSQQSLPARLDARTPAPDQGVPDLRAADQRGADQRAADQRGADQRAADQRAADQRAADQRAADLVRTPDTRSPDLRTPDTRSPDLRAPDLRTPDVRPPDVAAPDLAQDAARPPDQAGGGADQRVAYTGSFSPTVGFAASTLTVGGYARTIVSYVPAGMGTSKAVLFMFSPTNENDPYYTIIDSGAKALADTQKILILAPRARTMTVGDWDNHVPGDIYYETYPDVSPASNPDLLMVRASIQEAVRAYGVDPRRVYTAGFSNGGAFSVFCALTMPDKVAAFSEAAAGLVSCPTTQSCGFFSTTATTCSAFASAPGWCGCSGAEKPAAVPASGRVPPGQLIHARDDTTVSVYYSCALQSRMTALGATTSLTILTGGGHIWPTGYAQRVWPFVSQYTLP